MAASSSLCEEPAWEAQLTASAFTIYTYPWIEQAVFVKYMTVFHAAGPKHGMVRLAVLSAGWRSGGGACRTAGSCSPRCPHSGCAIGSCASESGCER